MPSVRFPLEGFDLLQPNEARLGVAGDLVLGANAEAALSHAPAGAWEPLAAWARDLDLCVVTLDATFPGPDPKPWRPLLFAGPHCVDRLPRGRQTLVNLGNNHAFDGGTPGFVALRDALERRGISTVGAGLTRDDAERAWRGTVRGQAVAVHSAVHPGCHPRPPLPDGGQVATVESPSWWRRVTESVDGRTFVVVVLHGGVQGSNYPSPAAITLSRRLAGLGVHAVVWSHAHAVQGVVRLGKSLVAYGLGNAMHLPLAGDPLRPHPDAAYERGLCLDLAPDHLRAPRAEGSIFERRGLELEAVTPSPELLAWFRRLSRRPAGRGYAVWWRGYRLKQDVLDGVIDYVRRHSLRTAVAGIRTHHLRSLLARVSNARADARDV
jgi:capsule synthesis protein PGA_cap